MGLPTLADDGLNSILVEYGDKFGDLVIFEFGTFKKLSFNLG